MTALTFISYKPSVNILKTLFTEGFWLIDNFFKSCNKLIKSVSQLTNQLVSQQHDKTSDNIYDHKFSAVFQDSFHDQSEYTTQWLCDELFSDCADYIKEKNDDSFKVQSKDNCQGEHELLTLWKNKFNSFRWFIYDWEQLQWCNVKM